MRQQSQNDSSYSGFEYRWNYEEYQRSLQKQRRRASGSGMQAFFLTTAFVFLICFTSLVMVLGAAFMRGEADTSLADSNTKAEPQNDNTLFSATHAETTDETQAKVEMLDLMQTTSAVQTESVANEELQGLLGILGENVTQADAQRFRLPIGVRIMTIYENASAYRAGLRRDDILLEIENMQITTLSELLAWEQTVIPGKEESVSVRIYRGGQELSFELIVQKQAGYTEYSE